MEELMRILYSVDMAVQNKDGSQLPEVNSEILFSEIVDKMAMKSQWRPRLHESDPY